MVSAAARVHHQQKVAGVRGRLLRLSLALPGAVMAASLLALVGWCHSLLAAASAGRAADPTGVGFWLAVGGFFAASAAVVVLQSVRLARRVAGPELRLRRALQRIRARDVGFRVTLRRGDLLADLARECNEVLEWLNANPPPGVRTGSDVVGLDDATQEPQP
jgi:hypothetical protein